MQLEYNLAQPAWHFPFPNGTFEQVLQQELQDPIPTASRVAAMSESSAGVANDAWDAERTTAKIKRALRKIFNDNSVMILFPFVDKKRIK